MVYRQIGNSELKVSVVSLGTWAIGGDYFGPVDEKGAIDALRAGLDSGMNLIDTAPVYGRGKSEEIVGKALKNGYRQKCVLATKCGVLRHWTQYVRCSDPFFIREGVEGSLRRLGTDVIDLFQLHWPDDITPIEASMETMLQLKKEGKIRCIGVSNFSVKQMEDARKCGEVVSTQPQYSLIDRDFDKEALPYCIRENIGVLSYGPLSGGILTGKYKTLPPKSADENRWTFYKGFSEPGFSKTNELLKTLAEIAAETGRPVSDVAIGWVTHQKGITTALVGVKTAAQAKANAEAGDVALSSEQLQRIDAAYKRIFG
jgi:aryl-alcohol dehydrogenase-like predicted oxidoreductase